MLEGAGNMKYIHSAAKAYWWKETQEFPSKNFQSFCTRDIPSHKLNEIKQETNGISPLWEQGRNGLQSRQNQ